MIEEEIEIKVKSLNPIRKQLKKKGKLIKRLKSKDFLFNEDLFSKDIILRLRDITFSYPKRKREAIITYKTPKQVKKGIQTRREFEFEADDFKSVFGIFQDLFGKPVLTFTWIGEKYSYGGCTFWLKDTIGILKFIEIEGKEKNIQKVRNELSIKGEILEIGALEFAKKVIRKGS